MLRTALSTAAVVAVLVVGGAFYVSQRNQPKVIAPGPTPSASPSPSQSSASPKPSPTVSASPVAPSLELTWTKLALDEQAPRVAWLGDRFVLVDVKSGAVRTSTDGTNWQALQPGDPDPGYVDLLRGSLTSWQDKAVGWWNPEDGPDYAGKPEVTARDILEIVRPPAAQTETTPFTGRIESIGIGPKGIVAQVHSDLDWDAWVTKKLGARSNNAWVTHLKSVDFRDGILQIKLDNGPGLKVVWADQGFELGDYQDAGFEWYSPDGMQWTAVPAVDPTSSDSGAAFPSGFGQVVGVSDGFIASGAYPEDACTSPDGACTGMWHSSDGLTWRFLGTAQYGGEVLLPWLGGALLTNGVGRFDSWTSAGPSELPMAAALPTPSEQSHATVGTGPLGLVTVGGDQGVLVSRDGVDHRASQMPAEMADAGRGRSAPTVAVGESTVLVLEWSGGDQASQIPSLWLGTFVP